MSQKEPCDKLEMNIQFADALALIRRFKKAKGDVNGIILRHPSFEPGASTYLRRLVVSQLSREDQDKVHRPFIELFACHKEWVVMGEKLAALVETEPGRSLAVELGLAKMIFGKATVTHMLG